MPPPVHERGLAPPTKFETESSLAVPPTESYRSYSWPSQQHYAMHPTNSFTDTLLRKRWVSECNSSLEIASFSCCVAGPSLTAPPAYLVLRCAQEHGSHRRISAVHTLFIPAWHEVAAQGGTRGDETQNGCSPPLVHSDGAPLLCHRFRYLWPHRRKARSSRP